MKERIKQLESQLAQKLQQDTETGKSKSEPATPAQSIRTLEIQDVSTVSRYNHINFSDEPSQLRDGEKECDTLGPTHYGPLQCGPLSLPYLVTRLQRHLCRTLPRSTLDFSIAQIAEPSCDTTPFPPLEGVHNLSRTQEELFLYPLWESFHPIYPVLSYKDFHIYYDSLWTGVEEGQSRQPSALVDSLLAVCTQYCSTFMEDNVGSFDDPTNTRVGYPHYLRSQALLMKELESPSVATVQAFIYSIIYLYNSSLLNTAYDILGIAIRVTQTLRLEFRPLPSTPPEQRGLHARIWWTLYQLDMVISMSLDRPFLVHLEDVPCSLPEDADKFLHSCNHTILQPIAQMDISWVSFHVQFVRLSAIFHGLHTVLKTQCAQMMQGSSSFDIHDDPNALESLAIFLERESYVVQDWVRAVPKSLKIRRNSNSEPMSPGRAHLCLDATSPIWLQRQQLLLELAYHDFQLSIYRPFLRIALKSSSWQPRADRMGLNALNHALAITDILHTLAKTEILRGWLPLLRVQWNAVLCILAFVIGNPICPFTPNARKGLYTAIQTLETMGTYCPSAHSAARIARHLMFLGESLTVEYRRGVDPRGSLHRSMSVQSWPQNQQFIPSANDLSLFGLPMDNMAFPDNSFDISRPISASSLDMTFPFTPPPTVSPEAGMAQQLLSPTMSMNLFGNDGQE